YLGSGHNDADDDRVEVPSQERTLLPTEQRLVVDQRQLPGHEVRGGHGAERVQGGGEDVEDWNGGEDQGGDADQVAPADLGEPASRGQAPSSGDTAGARSDHVRYPCSVDVLEDTGDAELQRCDDTGQHEQAD